MLANFNNTLIRLVKENVPGADGETRFCPICGYLGHFDPSASGKNVICPRCGSNERARLYFLYLSSIEFGKVPMKVLHILPETCIRYKINHLENVTYLSSGIDDLATKLRGTAYDLILANYVVDRVENDEEFLKKITSVLSKGGKAMVSVHFYNEDDLNSNPRKYSSEYIDILNGLGFKTEKITAEQLIGTPFMVLCGIPSNESIILIER